MQTRETKIIPEGLKGNGIFIDPELEQAIKGRQKRNPKHWKKNLDIKRIR